MTIATEVINNKMGNINNSNSNNVQVKQNATSNGIQMFGKSLNTSEAKINNNTQQLSSFD